MSVPSCICRTSVKGKFKLIMFILLGEDLIAEINDIRASVGAFTDTPNGAWMGCRGSKPIYGGYPCRHGLYLQLFA